MRKTAGLDRLATGAKVELGSGLTQREVGSWLEELPMVPGETPWLVVKATAANPVIDLLVVTDRRLYGMRRGIFKPRASAALRHGRALVGRAAGRHLWIPVDGGTKAIWALFENIADLERFSQVLQHSTSYAGALGGSPEIDDDLGEPPVDEEIWPAGTAPA